MDPILIGAGLTAGAQLLGGLLGSNASNKQARAAEEAARIQAAAADRAAAQQQAQFDTIRSDFSPYRQAGSASLGQLLSGMREGQFAAPEFGFQERQFNFNAASDPGAQYRMDRAMKAIQASAAARGGALGTGALRNMMRESQDMASQEFQAARDRFNQDEAIRYGRASDAYGRTYGARQDVANRLQSLAGMGQSSAAQTGAFGMQSAGQIGQLGMQGASALGEGLTRAAGARAAGTQAAFQGASDALGTGLGALIAQRRTRGVN